MKLSDIIDFLDEHQVFFQHATTSTKRSTEPLPVSLTAVKPFVSALQTTLNIKGISIPFLDG